MYPVICKIGPFTIYSYGLMLAVAFLVSSTLADLRAKREGFGSGIIFNFTFCVFIFGVLGARLFYVIENLNYYSKRPLETIMLQYGGLSWFGALAGAGISGLIYLKKKKLPVYKILDLVAPFVALAQAIGRVGCYLNGCCFGWLFFLPVQIYSSFLLVLIFIILRLLQDIPHKDGSILFTYLLLYSLKRFSVEFWRADNPKIIFGLTLFQLISIIIFACCALKLIYINKLRK